MNTKAMNIHARYPSERMNDANAKGILPLESNSSSGSILQTEIAYQIVIPVARIAQASGNPESVQNNGTEPSNNNKKQYILDSKSVLFGPFTSGIIGTPTFAYSPLR